jgi:hypothetical protein
MTFVVDLQARSLWWLEHAVLVTITRHNTGPSYASLEHDEPHPTISPMVLGQPVGASILSSDRGWCCTVRLGQRRRPSQFETSSHGGELVGSSVTQRQSRHSGKYSEVPQVEVFQAKSICLVRRSETIVRKRSPVTRRVAKCHGYRWHQSSSLIKFDKSRGITLLGCWRSMRTAGIGRCTGSSRVFAAQSGLQNVETDTRLEQSATCCCLQKNRGSGSSKTYQRNQNATA